METSTMTLIEFLTARLDEDEAVARAAGERSPSWPVSGTWHLEGVEHDVVGDEEAFCHPHNVDHIARHDPARVLREVEAKRAIVLLARQYDEPRDAFDGGFNGGANHVAVNTLRRLAAVYADHPDYREDW